MNIIEAQLAETSPGIYQGEITVNGERYLIHYEKHYSHYLGFVFGLPYQLTFFEESEFLPWVIKTIEKEQRQAQQQSPANLLQIIRERDDAIASLRAEVSSLKDKLAQYEGSAFDKALDNFYGESETVSPIGRKISDDPVDFIFHEDDDYSQDELNRVF